MRSILYAADEAGCGLYRCIWPTVALQEQGHDVAVYPPGHEKRLQAVTFVKDGQRRIIGDILVPEADVVVLQRPLNAYWIDVIGALQEAGIAVVVEIDDDLRRTHPSNVAHAMMQPSLNPDLNWAHLETCCSLADLVMVTTPQLARRYGGHGRALVVPNCVPERVLKIERDSHYPLRLGWTGMVATHPTDLQVVGGGVARAMGPGVEFWVVGSARGVDRALGLRHISETGMMPTERYHAAYAQLDVAIAPLAESSFNEAKSWLKVLEAAACGVPCVASPSSEYRRAAAEGMCELADKPKTWTAKVRQFLVDPYRRAEFAERAREAAGRWTIEGNAWRWMEAFETAKANFVGVR